MTTATLETRETFIDDLEDFDSNSQIRRASHHNQTAIYDSELDEYSRISKEETRKLAQKKDLGNIEARNAIVLANLRLARDFARCFIKNAEDEADFIQEGNLGLIIAANKFNWEKGYNFSTYATWWIKHYIWQYLSTHNSDFHIPVAVLAQKRKLDNYCLEYFKENGTRPSDAEIIRKLKISNSMLKQLKLFPETCSLSTPIGTDSFECELEDVIVDTSCDVEHDVESNIIGNILLNRMKEILSERQFYVILKRFAFDGNKQTLEQIGAHFSITQEAVRQLEKKALSILAKDPIIKEYAAYYNLN